VRKEVIDNLVRIINERRQFWGVKAEGFEISHKPGLVVITLFAEANDISFPASLVVIPQSGEVFFGGAAYINFGLRYSTIVNCPQAAAIPVAAHLIGCYLREIAPHLKTTMCICPSFGEAYSLIRWWLKEDLTKPILEAKVIVKERSHQITIVHYPDIEVETDIYEAPQFVKVRAALCEL
jgi:hypothetical protein